MGLAEDDGAHVVALFGAAHGSDPRNVQLPAIHPTVGTGATSGSPAPSPFPATHSRTEAPCSAAAAAHIANAPPERVVT